METLASPIGVFLLLALVATAALGWQPSGFSGSWAKLAAQFESKVGPQSIDFPHRTVLIDGQFIFYDITVERSGLWLVYNGPSPKVSPDYLFVPMEFIRLLRETDRTVIFELGEENSVTAEFQNDVASNLRRWVLDVD